TRIVPALGQLSGSIGLLWNGYPFVQGLHDLRSSIAAAQAAGPEPVEKEEWDGRWAELCLARGGYSYPATEARALRDVTLALRRGGAYGVAGPSGAGKSTRVDLLLRLLDPTEGT